nr:hypothetical protein [Burkholderia sp. Z1]
MSLATTSAWAELTVPPVFVRDCVARSVVSPAADPIVPDALPMLLAVTDRPLPPTIAPDRFETVLVAVTVSAPVAPIRPPVFTTSFAVIRAASAAIEPAALSRWTV